MDTPIYDFLRSYADSGTLRAHMPGHKGNAAAELGELFKLDITEIKGADSLFEAEGIIAQSEDNTAKLYGSKTSVFSAGGSTLCIQAMLALMKQERRRVIAVRNVHRAFLNAAALLRLEVQWIMPRYSGGILSGELQLADVAAALAADHTPACVYVTSPDLIGVELLGSGDFECRSHLDTDNLDVMLKGSGDIVFSDIICDRIKTSVIGSGDLTIEKAVAQTADVELIGSGDVKIKQQKVKQTKVELKGSGDIKMNLTNCGTIDCRLLGSGDITLQGDVMKLNSYTRGSGDIDTQGLKIRK